MSSLTKDLRFHGRFGTETEQEAKLRRFNERNQAADLIEKQEAHIKCLRDLLSRVSDGIASDLPISKEITKALQDTDPGSV